MATDIWTKVKWHKEARDLGPNRASGALITRISGGMIATNNNYLPGGCSPDGQRVVAIRWLDHLVGDINALLVLGVETKWTALLDPDLADVHVLPVPFTGICYYTNREQELCRVSLDTFEKEVVMNMRAMPSVSELLRAVTPDGRFVFYQSQIAIKGGLSLAIVKVDTRERSFDVIYESPGLHSFAYVPGANALMFGRRLRPDGSTPPLGAWKNAPGNRSDTHLMDLNGRILRALGPGRGYGYIDPATGQVVYTYDYDPARAAHDPRRPSGNMVVCDNIDSQDGRTIEAPQHIFYHLSGSNCGRYVVAEALRPGLGALGPLDIVLVNWRTGKHRVLVEDCGTRGAGGGNAWRQCLPYLTSDNSNVIFNADPDGVLNVYSAKVPDGFLASLD